jgi:hypothetical protein
MSDLPIAELAWRDVVALHAFFERWFRADGDAEAFDACERALASDFRMIGPDGNAHGRTSVIDRVKGARGTAPADFRIDVEDAAAIWVGQGAVLLEYTERQYRDGRSTRRRSSALFLAEAGAPNGVVWRHLQETWIDPPVE